MENDVTSNKLNSAKSPDGNCFGQDSADLVGFYGASPVVQPSGAAQAAIVDPGDGTAAPTNGVASLTATYNSTILENAFATIVAQGNALRSALVDLGLIAGS